jgi:hypothetical protein
LSKYEQLDQLPSALKRHRTYRTREEPFARDRPELETMLEQAADLDANGYARTPFMAPVRRGLLSRLF